MSNAAVYISLTETNLRHVKRALVDRFEVYNVKSAHLTEALAAALGRRTHAALLTDLRTPGVPEAPLVPLDDAAFVARITDLTGRRMIPPSEAKGLFHDIEYPDGADVIRTWSPGFERVDYNGGRRRAWRNMMVAAINAGIEQRLFSMRRGDNRWPGADQDRHGPAFAHRYGFDVCGIPALAAVEDGGFNELRVFVAFWPTPQAERWVDAIGYGFEAGEAWAAGWLERRSAAHLQVAGDCELKCRKARLAAVAALEVEPKGYADRGSFRW